MKVWPARLLAIFSFLALLPATIFLTSGLIFFIGAIKAIFDNQFFLSNGSIDYEFLFLTLSYVNGLLQFGSFGHSLLRLSEKNKRCSVGRSGLLLSVDLYRP